MNHVLRSMLLCQRRSFLLRLCCGLCAGYLCCSLLQYIVLPCVYDTQQLAPDIAPFITHSMGKRKIGHETIHLNTEVTTDRNLVLVGVMTAKVFLTTRAAAAYKTWVSSIPGKVIFFSSEGSEAVAPPGLPVIGLPGVDDSYPPQKKSFMMLKYMHDHYLGDYRFFMRADDDVYIKGETLAKLLHSINSSRALFIGQAGLGNKEEYGMLQLSSRQNFCMGGPGMILTATTLRLVVPHIGQCLANLLTTHEDVELGRCISRYAKVSCTWTYEMQKILYNNYNEPKGSFSHSLKDTDIHNAACLHPVKDPAYQFRLVQYFLARRAAMLRNELVRLQRELSTMNDLLQDRDEFYSPSRYGLQPSLLKSVPKARNEVLEWDFISKSIYSAKHVNPRRGLEADLKLAVDDVIMQVMELINENARQRGRVIEYREILYGYHRVNPLHGVDLILDLLLFYKKFKGKRKMTVPVRRHAYLQQPFLHIEVIDDPAFRQFALASDYEHAATSGQPKYNIFQKFQQGIGLGTESETDVKQSATINFVLPLSGRYKTFLQFIRNFEEVCLRRDERVSLAVMLFRSEQDDRTDDTTSYVAALQQKYPNHRLTVERMSGTFSRGLGLQRGAALYKNEDLLFFIDVDIYLHAEALERVLLNTIPGRQVYYPIVFSQYDPQFICEKGNSSCPSRMSPFDFDSQFGYWRQFGYGIAALYKSDLKRVGGFNLDIKGWGKEDVDLLHKFIHFNISVFRAVDCGLVHIFHSILCDPSLEPAQYQMCLGSKAASYASTEKLASIVYETSEIFHRNELPDKAATHEGGADQEAGES